MKSWFQYNDIEIYSTNNEVKPFTAGRFIRAIKNNIHEHVK